MDTSLQVSVFHVCISMAISDPGPAYNGLCFQLLSVLTQEGALLSSFYYSRVPDAVTCSCVQEERRKYHPMGDDTGPASASSDQDSAQ